MVRKLVNNFIHTYAAPPSPFVRGGGGEVDFGKKKILPKIVGNGAKTGQITF